MVVMTETEGGEKKQKRTMRGKEKREFTFDDKFSKVWDPRAPGGLSDTAVKVLICPLDAV